MLGERLAEIRKNYHDTQKSLADKLGLTVWAVSAWEQGRNSPPSDVLLAICKLYGTSADYLLGLPRRGDAVGVKGQLWSFGCHGSSFGSLPVALQALSIPPFLLLV